MITTDIAAYLQTAGLGTVGTDIFKGYIPESPNDCTVLFQRGGQPPEVVRTPVALEYPELHVIVRRDGDTAYEDAMGMANDIMIALHTLYEQTINARRYLYIRALSSPTLLRYDYSQRPPHVYVAIDFAVTKECES